MKSNEINYSSPLAFIKGPPLFPGATCTDVWYVLGSSLIPVKELIMPVLTLGFTPRRPIIG